MNEETFLLEAPWLSKVLVALLLAEEALAVLGESELGSTGKNAVDAGWQWVERRAVRAEVLNDYGSRLSELSSRSMDESRTAAVCAVGIALYYVAWCAYREELEMGTTDGSDVPNNIAEVVDDDL